MGGAWSVEQITKSFRAIGFTNVTVVSEEVTEAYARKWGHGLAIREYIQSSLIYAEKPLSKSRGKLSKPARKVLKKTPSGVCLPSLAAIPAADANQKPAQEAGDMSPPGDSSRPSDQQA